MKIPVIISAVGIILVVWGVFYPVYVIPDDFYDYGNKNKFNRGKRYISALESFIAPSRNSKIYKLIDKVISIRGIEITVSRFWLYKILCITLAFSFLSIVSATNTNIIRQNIMGSWWQNTDFMDTITAEEYKYNISLYNEVLLRIGERNLRKVRDEEKVEKITWALHEIRGETYVAKGKAEALLSAFNNVENIRVITLNIVLTAIISFFMPEIFLFLRKVIIGKKYQNEAIKMENIFGLLGSMEEYKTICIIKDMAAASKLFSNKLNHAATIFYTDKNKSFEYLKFSIKEKSFTRLVDVMRIYSTVDKKLALSILERNLKEHEEQLLLSAEEDMDVIDILAFISIVPIIYEIANLMLSPMLEVVFKVFDFI